MTTVLARDEAREVNISQNQDVLGQVLDNAKKLLDIRGDVSNGGAPTKTRHRLDEFIPKFIRREIANRIQGVLNSYSRKMEIDTILVVNDSISLGSLAGWKDVIEIINGRRVVHKNKIIDVGGKVDPVRNSNGMFGVNSITFEIIFGADRGAHTFNINVSDLWNDIRLALVKSPQSSNNLNNMAKDEYLRRWDDALTSAIDKGRATMEKNGNVSPGRLNAIAKMMTSKIKGAEQSKNRLNQNDLTGSIVNGEKKKIKNSFSETNRIALLDGLAKTEKIYFRENAYRHLMFRWVDVSTD